MWRRLGNGGGKGVDWWCRASRWLKIPDAAIAATAADCAMPLVSRDQGFRKVKEVSLVAA